MAQRFTNTFRVVSILSVFFLSLVYSSLAAADNHKVGTVTRAQNMASVTRLGQIQALTVGGGIHERDVVETGAGARLEITFEDGTKLLLGEGGRLTIDKFLFDPEQDVGTAVIGVLRGAFRIITGSIGKLKSKLVEARTKYATIGIRGTDFFSGPALGKYGVLLFDGTVIVRNQAGGRILGAPGTGLNLTAIDELPSEVIPWGDKRVRAALQAVSFK